MAADPRRSLSEERKRSCSEEPVPAECSEVSGLRRISIVEPSNRGSMRNSCVNRASIREGSMSLYSPPATPRAARMSGVDVVDLGSLVETVQKSEHAKYGGSPWGDRREQSQRPPITEERSLSPRPLLLRTQRSVRAGASATGSATGSRAALLGRCDWLSLAALWTGLCPRFEQDVEVHFARFKSGGLRGITRNGALCATVLAAAVHLGVDRRYLYGDEYEGTLLREVAQWEAGIQLLLVGALWLLYLLLVGCSPLFLVACAPFRLCCALAPGRRRLRDSWSGRPAAESTDSDAALPPAGGDGSESATLTGPTPLCLPPSTPSPSRQCSTVLEPTPTQWRTGGEEGEEEDREDDAGWDEDDGGGPPLEEEAGAECAECAASVALRYSDGLFMLVGVVYTAVLAFTPTRLLVLANGDGGTADGARAAQRHTQAAYLAELMEERTLAAWGDAGEEGEEGEGRGGRGGRGADGLACLVAPAQETRRLLAMVVAMAYLAIYCRLSATHFLLLGNWAAGWYLFCRVWWGDLDAAGEWADRAADVIAFYLVLGVLFLGARRAEVQLRADFMFVYKYATEKSHAKERYKDARLQHDKLERATNKERAAMEKELAPPRVDHGARGPRVPAASLKALTISKAPLQRLRSDMESRDDRSQRPPDLPPSNPQAQGKISERLKRTLIDPADLKLGELLGCGSFGEVHRAEWRGTPVAVKRLARRCLSESHLSAFIAECELMLTLRHPHIVQLIGGSWRPDHHNTTVAMVLELCGHGTLTQLLGSARGPSLTWCAQKLGIATGIARAMAYLHAQSPPVIHRDLKPDNILIDDGFNAKVGDFGVSREVVELTMTQSAGTPLYAAPEIMRKERHGSAG